VVGEYYLLMALMLCCVVIFMLAIAIFVLCRHYAKIERDLLDRLMARDFADYSVHSSVSKKTPLKRWSTSDEAAAKLEQSRGVGARS